jgi:protein SCO1/2
MDEKDQTSFEDKNLAIKTLIFSTVVFGSMLLINKKMNEVVKKKKDRLAGLEEEMTEKDKINAVGGHWVLKDLKGRDFGSGNLQGSYYLLYFGFSLCPDICPLSLMKMNKVVKRI